MEQILVECRGVAHAAVILDLAAVVRGEEHEARVEQLPLS